MKNAALLSPLLLHKKAQWGLPPTGQEEAKRRLQRLEHLPLLFRGRLGLQDRAEQHTEHPSGGGGEELSHASGVGALDIRR